MWLVSSPDTHQQILWVSLTCLYPFQLSLVSATVSWPLDSCEDLALPLLCSLAPPNKKREGHLVSSRQELKSQCTSPNLGVKVPWAPSCSVRTRVPSYLAFSHYSLVRVEVKMPPCRSLFFFGVARMTELLFFNLFSLAWLILGLLVRDNTLSLGLYFVCACWHFQVNHSPSIHSKMYKAKSNPREITAMSFLGSQSPKLFCLFLFNYGSSYVCCIILI